MRITIVPSDGVITVDGFSVSNLDLSSVSSSVHAVQWYGDAGEVEIVDGAGRMTQNRDITSMAEFQPVLDKFFEAKQKIEADARRVIEEQTILEV